MNTLAVLEDVGNETHFVTTFKTMLTSSVLVTGALLVGTGNCSVMGHSISINASILTPHIGKRIQCVYLAAERCIIFGEI